MRLVLVLSCLAAVVVPARGQGASAGGPVLPEVRGLWVDAFHAGIRSPAEAEHLVREAKRANLNLLFVQVRRRGDALFTKGIEPALDDPAYDPTFDALAHLIAVAHREGLKVHAWINAMPVWQDEAPPKDPRHVFNRHGPTAAGDQMWLTSGPDGVLKFPVGYFLDPGHPGVQDYIPGIFVNVVREYDVDGIHFDYIRYPETETSPPRGATVGYNPTALARFRRATGRTDTPEAGDEQWIEWRRRQVSHLVRRVYLEAKAVKPDIVISAAVIPWGPPPTSEADFAEAAPMQRVFQDWHGWLEEGILDLAVPMNYARETDDRVRPWFDGWVAWQRRHAHGRQIAVGLGAYRNTPSDLLAQIARVRQADGGDRLAGVSLFSYAVPSLPAVPTGENGAPLSPEPLPEPGADRLAFLADGVPPAPAPFDRPAPLPAMAWIDRPSRGWIGGIVRAGAPDRADDLVVAIRRTGWFEPTKRVRTDAIGFFGLTDVAPGTYRVRLEHGGLPRASVQVRVVAGRVARADLEATPRGGRQPAVHMR